MSDLVWRLRYYANFYRNQGWNARMTIVKCCDEAADRVLELQIENRLLKEQLNRLMQPRSEPLRDRF